MLGIALNMARHGHPTTILAYQWGDQSRYPLPENVTLQGECRGKCDYFLDVGWDSQYAPQRFADVQARHYVHGWGGDPAGSTFLPYAQSHRLTNHYMARNSRALRAAFDRYPFSIYAPTPLVQHVPEAPNFDSRRTLWANRGAFHPTYAPYSEQVLALMERLPDYEHTVLLWGDVKTRATDLGRPDIVTRFEGLPKVKLDEPYWGIPHDAFLRALGDSKLLLANGQGSIPPQTLEAVCMGCVPLLWPGPEHHFGDIAHRHGLLGTAIERVLEGRGAFTEYYNDLAEVARDHEWDRSYALLIRAFEEKEAQT